MKILWLSNKILSDQDASGTGTWLDAMSQALLKSGSVVLGNITLGHVREATCQNYGSIQQWVVPSSQPSITVLSKQKIMASVAKVVDEFSPDLIHVWGTEGFWGLLTARKILKYPVLLEMQGLKAAIAEVYAGGLSFSQQLASIGPKELIRQTTIFQVERQYKAWGIYEEEIISGHQNISVHSEWMKAKVNAINPTARLFRNTPIIRDSFYDAPPWKYAGPPVIFCSASYPAPFKGLHIALRSIAILRRHFPGIQLRIAGPHQRSRFRSEGYIKWINQEIHRLHLEPNVVWLGPLSSGQLINEFHQSSAFVLPTFMESYGVALVEAMILGVPSVVSFTGGTSYLAKDEDSALFFPPGDYEMCAYLLERLLTESALGDRLSRRAREVALMQNNREQIIRNQIETYRQVLSEVNTTQKSFSEISEARS